MSWVSLLSSDQLARKRAGGRAVLIDYFTRFYGEFNPVCILQKTFTPGWKVMNDMRRV